MTAKSANKDKVKRGKGRPKHEPSELHRNVVEKMLKKGVPQQDAADAVGVSINTFKKHYAQEIRETRCDITERCYAALLRLIDNDDFNAIRYYLDRVFGNYGKLQKDLEEHKHVLRMKEQDKANEGLKEQAKVLAPVVVEEVGKSIRERIQDSVMARSEDTLN